MRGHQHILELALEYAKVSNQGQMQVCSKVCEWTKTMSIAEIEQRLKRMIKTYKSVWNLHTGDRCYIIKENGKIIETRFDDNDYFRGVRVYGNLAVSQKQAEKILFLREKQGRMHCGC